MAYAAPNPPDSTPVAAPTLSPVSPNAAEIPHACEPETLATGPSPADRARLLGIDVARALAVLGMVAVHLVPDASGDGMSPAFIISSGKSAALFAVLAGVGIALSTGREHRPRGRRWLGSLAAVTVRAVLIALVGLALGLVVSSERADVILVAYAAMFLLALPLLRLPPWALAILATALAIGMPILSHSLRLDLPLATLANPSFVTLARDPAGTMLEVFLTGAFPALSWLAYLCAGLAVGRSVLSRRGTAVRLAVIGAVAAVLASAGSWYLLERRGGLAALTGAATEVMSREDFTDTLVWGAEGTLPTNSPWWLAVLAPHTTTPFDLVFTLGIALAVLGVTLTLALVAPRFLRPVAIFGSLPLTLYALHLLLLAAPWLPETGWPAFGLHVVVLAVFALVWRHFFPRGPLEQVLWWSAHAVEDRIAPRRRIR